MWELMVIIVRTPFALVGLVLWSIFGLVLAGAIIGNPFVTEAVEVALGPVLLEEAQGDIDDIANHDNDGSRLESRNDPFVLRAEHFLHAPAFADKKRAHDAVEPLGRTLLGGVPVRIGNRHPEVIELDAQHPRIGVP